MNNTDLLDEFCDSLWLEDGLSTNTLESYRRDLNKFSSWLEQQRGVNLLETSYADIQGFLAYSPQKTRRRASSMGPTRGRWGREVAPGGEGALPEDSS